MEIDAIQYSTGQRPYIEAADRSRIVRSEDLDADPRWPVVAEAASAAGVRSLLSFPLFTPPVRSVR